MVTDNLCQLEALMNRLNQDRASLQHPVGVSPRTRSTISADSNAAEKIERHNYQRRGVGIVHPAHQCLGPEGQDLHACHNLLKEGCFKLTVIANSSTQAVRRHFREWCARMVREDRVRQKKSKAVSTKRRRVIGDCRWGIGSASRLIKVQLVGIMPYFCANLRDLDL
ncbi:hypothetical protein F4804DRAFT_339302 [Jackrogersella minutella]|nr:hypothetical protein F4804DRAFT_339302 [Jackrogersella minutella]